MTKPAPVPQSGRAYLLGAAAVFGLCLAAWFAGRTTEPVEKRLLRAVDPECLAHFTPEKIVEIPHGKLRDLVTEKRLPEILSSVRDFFSCKAFAAGDESECARIDAQIAAGKNRDRTTTCGKRFHEGLMLASSADPRRAGEFETHCRAFFKDIPSASEKAKAEYCTAMASDPIFRSTPEAACEKIKVLGSRDVGKDCAASFVWLEAEPKKCRQFLGSAASYCTYMAKFVAALRNGDSRLTDETPYAPLFAEKGAAACAGLGESATRLYCRALVDLEDESAR